MIRQLNPVAILSIGLALSACERVEAPPANEAADSNVTASGQAAAPQLPADSGPAAPDASDPPVALAATGADLQWGPCPPGMPEGCEIAVLHGDPAKPNADIFLRVPGGAPIAPHWHSSAERMMLATGRLEVQYQGSAAVTLEPGTYAYGPARLPHRADCRSSEPCTLFIAFEGPVDRHPYGGEL
jgi:hypothetical protein